MLAQLTEAFNKAQNELAAAEIALLEASAAATQLREEAGRLEAAVAALSGRPLAAKESTPVESPEEFERRRKERQKQKEANDPLANVKCSGCGERGNLSEVYKQTSGSPIRMLVCGCGNQML